MAYEKLNLQKGEVLKAEHLAHIETGIAENDAATSELKENIVDVQSDVSEHGETIEMLGKTVNELAESVDDAITNLPTEDTALELLGGENANRVMTEQMLDVIGYWLTDGLPTDEVGQEIVYRMNEQQRLLDELFTEMTEREGA